MQNLPVSNLKRSLDRPPGTAPEGNGAGRRNNVITGPAVALPGAVDHGTRLRMAIGGTDAVYRVWRSGVTGRNYWRVRTGASIWAWVPGCDPCCYLPACAATPCGRSAAGAFGFRLPAGSAARLLELDGSRLYADRTALVNIAGPGEAVMAGWVLVREWRRLCVERGAFRSPDAGLGKTPGGSSWPGLGTAQLRNSPVG